MNFPKIESKHKLNIINELKFEIKKNFNIDLSESLIEEIIDCQGLHIKNVLLKGKNDVKLEGIGVFRNVKEQKEAVAKNYKMLNEMGLNEEEKFWYNKMIVRKIVSKRTNQRFKREPIKINKNLKDI